MEVHRPQKTQLDAKVTRGKCRYCGRKIGVRKTFCPDRPVCKKRYRYDSYLRWAAKGYKKTEQAAYKRKQFKPEDSGRRCNKCGKDPWPNRFNCKSCLEVMPCEPMPGYAI